MCCLDIKGNDFQCLQSIEHCFFQMTKDTLHTHNSTHTFAFQYIEYTEHKHPKRPKVFRYCFVSFFFTYVFSFI